MTAATSVRNKVDAPLDLSQAQCIDRTWHEHKQLTWYTVLYPARSNVAGNGFYELQGWSNGTEATCTCDGFKFRQRCRHATAWPLILEHLEQTYQATKATADIIACLEFWQIQREPLNADQRLAQNAQRSVLMARGVRYTDAIPLAARLGIVARGKRAASEIFGEPT